MRYHFALIGAAVLILAALAGCTGTPGESHEAGPSAAAAAYSRGLAEYEAEDYRTAGASFQEAYTLAAGAGDTATARAARNAMFLANRTIMEFPYNRSDAEAAMREAAPGITDDQVRDWLDTRAQTIVSDDEVLYFCDVGADYLYAYPEELQKQGAGSLDFDFVARYALAGDQPAGAGPYQNPVRYAGVETLAIPHEILPATGTLRIWYPLPVGTDSQRDITVGNLSHTEYIAAGPFTTGPIGYVYYEIPVEEIAGDLTISADIAFTSYEQRFEIDPASVGEYDTGDPEYILYTASERNIEITDAVRKKAGEIVGDETNPHLRAQMIYHHIIETYPYSHVPHGSLDARVPKIAESTYMFETGHGDCGTQSMLFSAFCRSLGIPARAIGGYQMLLAEDPGTHFWAEYFLPGYGWVPCDPTVADVADWLPVPDEEREAFKEYYAMNLDPARLVIQKNVDTPMDPPIPDDAVVFRVVRQQPAIVSDTADYDIDLACMGCFNISLSADGT